MQANGTSSKVVDYIFWIVFIIFTNPGGILGALGETRGGGGMRVTDILFAVLFACFIIVHRKRNFQNDVNFTRIIKYLLLFLCYYLIVFTFFIPVLKNTPGHSPITAYIKARHGIIDIFLVVMIYEFYLRSYMIFYKMLLYSSIIVLSLFVISVVTGVDILPIDRVNRKFIETKRLILTSYGLMPFLVPMGAVLLIFKFKFINYRKLIYIGFSLMMITWILAIFRRHIFGAVIYIIVTLFLFNYLNKKSLIPVGKFFNIALYAIILAFIIKITFPEYADAGVAAVEETIYVMQHGESTTGKTDSRFGLGKTFIQDKISENYMVGTGFDNRWRTSDGDASGYEATDYPFLGAVAMYGVVGLLFFLPLYIMLLKSMLQDIKYLRINGFDYNSFDAYMMVLFIVYFMYDFMQYMNWFLPLSVNSDVKWYVFVGMYFASRKLFYTTKIRTEGRVKLQNYNFSLQTNL